MSSRRKGRILAFQALYAWDASEASLEDLLEFNWLEKEKLSLIDDESRAFTSLLIAGTIENINSIDEIIRKHVENWRFERIKKVDLAILRMSIYGIIFQHDIPAQITIDEAIEIAKEYGSDDSYKFINGVLDSVWKKDAKI